MNINMCVSKISKSVQKGFNTYLLRLPSAPNTTSILFCIDVVRDKINSGVSSFHISFNVSHKWFAFLHFHLVNWYSKWVCTYLMGFREIASFSKKSVDTRVLCHALTCCHYYMEYDAGTKLSYCPCAVVTLKQR